VSDCIAELCLNGSFHQHSLTKGLEVLEVPVAKRIILHLVKKKKQKNGIQIAKWTARLSSFLSFLI
jgi:hypothetical protein